MTEMDDQTPDIGALAHIEHNGKQFRFRHDNTTDHIFKFLKQTGRFYEVDLLGALAGFIGPDDHVVDVGANIGTHSIFFSGVCGCRVTAFEANPAAAAILTDNVRLNALDRLVTIDTRAVGAVSGSGRIVLPDRGNLGTARIEVLGDGDIAIVPLDEHLGDRAVRLIKIDVEGMELEVLRGARACLQRHHPVVALEARSREDYISVQSYLSELGYSAAGSFAYTPTHLFVDLDHEDPRRVIASLAAQLAQTSLSEFEHTNRLTQLKTSVGRLQTAVAASEVALAGAKGDVERQDAETRSLKEATESLRVEVAHSEAGLRTRVAEVGKQIEAISKSVGSVQSSLAATDSLFGRQLETALRAVAGVQSSVTDTHATLGSTLANVSDRLTDEITKLGQRIDSHTSRLDAGQDTVGRRTSELLTDLRRVLVEEFSTQARRIEVATSEQSARTTVQVVAETAALRTALDGVANTVLTRFGKEQVSFLSAQESALTSAIGAMTARIEGLVEQRFASIGSAMQIMGDRFEQALGSLTHLEAAFGRLADNVAQARRQTSQIIEMQLLIGSVLEAAVHGVAGDVRQQQESLVDGEVLPYVRRQLDEIGRILAETLGRQLAQIDLAAASGRPGVPHEASSAELPSLDAVVAALDLAAPPQRVTGPAPVPVPAVPNMPSPVAVGRAEPNKPRSRWTLKPEAVVLADDSGRLKPAAVAGAGTIGTPSIGTLQAPAARRAMPDRFGAPEARVLVEVDYRRGWTGLAWAQPATELADGGRVLCKRPERDAGVIGATYDVTGGSIVEFEVVSSTLGAAGAKRILRLFGGANEPIGYDFPLSDGVTVIRTFVPSAITKLRYYILASQAQAGPLFALETLTLREVDSDAHQRAVRAAIGEPLYASMASIPSRVSMLRDTVSSLLAQCDIVRVFLNNYPEVPTFLNHRRVQVCRSQDWDDRGDAGKMFWIDRDGDDHGYRLIVDDDLIFPPEFSRVMAEKVGSHDRRAIYGTHAILLRQPFVNYYDKSARALTFHFGHEIKTDRGAHIGATNALCLHTSAINMRWPDFKYCNSADVWLALHAQDAKIPVLTPARPRNWVREGRHANPDETIYASSLKRTRTRFDSSFVQDAVLNYAGPLTLHTTRRRKLGIAFLATNGAELKEAVSSFLALRSLEAEWVVLVAGPLGEEAFASELAQLAVGHETHLIDSSTGSAETLQRIAALHARFDLQATLIVDERIRLVGSTVGKATELDATVSVGGRTLNLLRHTDNTGETGLGLIDAASLDAFAGAFVSEMGEPLRLDFDVGGGGLLTGQLLLEAANGPAKAQIIGRRRVPRGATANDFFDRIQVLNLDRRPDRWAAASQQLGLAGVRAERFSAVDGTRPEIAAEYQAYAAQPLVRLSPDVPRVASSFDVYHNYVSQQARIAHLEGVSGKKAIASAGAWGYMRSYEAILEQALADRVESLLAFDDDVVFHRNFAGLFAKAVSQLPDDWLILQLGTLQYHWTKPWADWRSDNLYVTNGSAVGSHAVGMRFDALPSLIDHVKRMDMPFDIGALSAVTKSFPDRCFVISPNLAIQRIGDSDINTSDFQKVSSREEIAATYRWTLADYWLDG